MLTKPQTNKSQGRVFISYSSKNRDLVAWVRDQLILRGVASVWFDRDDIGTGQDWRFVIHQGLENCSHMVLFVSEDALESEVVKEEYETFNRLRKAEMNEETWKTGNFFIPAFVEDVPHNNLPPLIKDANWLRPTFYEDKQKAVENLAVVMPKVKYNLPGVVHVPAGSFTMGEPGKTYLIDLNEFWIGKHIVTTADFAHFVRSGAAQNRAYYPDFLSPSELSKHIDTQEWLSSTLNGGGVSLESYANAFPLQPMRGVTWAQAYAYCRWLNMVTGKDDCYRLPTDAEWEKAARGTDSRVYPWGNGWQNGYANTREAGHGRPLDCGALGTAGDSPYGCQDMAGNVWEWTFSRPESGPYVNDGRREILEPLDRRIIRGGSWNHYRSEVRTFDRGAVDVLDTRFRKETGFRIVATYNPGE